MRKRPTGPPRFLASETKVTLDPSPLSELSDAPVSAGPAGPVLASVVVPAARSRTKTSSSSIAP